MRIPDSMALALVVALAASACGTPTARGAHDAPSSEDGPARVRAFQTAEDEILRDLSAIDRRLAARARIRPRDEDLRRIALAAVFEEDPSLGVIDGAIDPFSFDARARGLTAVKAKIERLPTDLPQRSSGLTPLPSFERGLLVRLVEEELVRLKEERQLPRSASALFPGLVKAGDPAPPPSDAELRDRLLARRLEEVRESLEAEGPPSAALDRIRARELDDALDALEHVVDVPGFTRATAELVSLREALEAQAARPVAKDRLPWDEIGRSARAHLGIDVADAGALARRLGAAEVRARAMAEPALAEAGLDQDATEARLEKLLFSREPCASAVPGSRVRSLAPPPERTPACHLHRAVATADDPASRAIALTALHDHIVVARWALAVASGEASIEQAMDHDHLLTPPSPALRARLERVALARPVTAIGAGIAADILLAGGESQVRAKAWGELGEVPLDIAARELPLRPVD
jgi:hypothetical protein